MRGQAEDSLEGDVSIEAAVVAEDKLVEVAVDVLSAQAVIGAEPPPFQRAIGTSSAATTLARAWPRSDAGHGSARRRPERDRTVQAVPQKPRQQLVTVRPPGKPQILITLGQRDKPPSAVPIADISLPKISGSQERYCPAAPLKISFFERNYVFYDMSENRSDNDTPARSRLYTFLKWLLIVASAGATISAVYIIILTTLDILYVL